MKKYYLEVNENPFFKGHSHLFQHLEFCCYFSTYREVYDKVLSSLSSFFSGNEEEELLLKNEILHLVRLVMRNYREKSVSSLSFTYVVNGAISDYRIICSFNKEQGNF